MMVVSVPQFAGGVAEVRHVRQPATALHAVMAAQHDDSMHVPQALGIAMTVEQSNVPASPALASGLASALASATVASTLASVIPESVPASVPESMPASVPESGAPPSGLHEGGGVIFLSVKQVPFDGDVAGALHAEVPDTLPPLPPPAEELELDVVELVLPEELAVVCELVVPVPPLAVLVFVVPPQAIQGRPAARTTIEKIQECFLILGKYQGGASVNSAKWPVCAVAAGR
jgi:hypothetical protein